MLSFRAICSKKRLEWESGSSRILKEISLFFQPKGGFFGSPLGVWISYSIAGFPIAIALILSLIAWGIALGIIILAIQLEWLGEVLISIQEGGPESRRRHAR